LAMNDKNHPGIMVAVERAAKMNWRNKKAR